MPTDITTISIEQFEKAGWQDAIASSAEPLSHLYSTEFASLAGKAKSEGDEVLEIISRLFSEVTHYRLAEPDKDDPFKPVWQGSDGRRSGVPSDLTQQEIQFLETVKDTIEDDEFAARVYDVLWVLKRDHTVGRQAIDRYLNSYDRLKAKKSVEAFELLSRAIKLARMFDRATTLPKIIAKAKADALQALKDEEDFLGIRTIELLLDFKEATGKTFASSLRSRALALEPDTDRFKERRFLELEMKLHVVDSNVEAQNEVIELIIKSYEAEEADFSGQGEHTRSTWSVTQAIEVLRRTGGKREQIDELHARLVKHQEASLSEMGTVRSEFTIGEEEIQKAKSVVAGYPLHVSIYRFIQCIRIPTRDEIKAEYIATSKGSPLMMILGRNIINKQGRVVGRIPPLNLDPNTPEDDEAFNMRLYEQCGWHWQMDGLMIDLVREFFVQEHNVTPNELQLIINYSPFVPPGRASIYAKALAYGFYGEWLECIHLLVPQLENSLRYLLYGKGLLPSFLDSEYIQDEAPLNVVFTRYKDELIDVLGDGIYLFLRGLLCEKFSANIRNLSGHGLMDPEDFEGYNSRYLWWLSLYLIYMPMIPRRRVPTPAESEASETAVILEQENNPNENG